MTGQTGTTPPEQPQPPAPTPPASQPWLGWAAVILVGILVIIGIALASEQLNDNKQPVGAEVQITPIVGGMAVAAATAAGDTAGGEQSGEPSVVATQSAVVSATESVSAAEELSVSGAVSAAVSDVTSETELVTATETLASRATQVQPAATVEAAPVFDPGVVVQNTTGDVMIFAEPNRDGQVLDSYAAGMELVVLEPGGDFAAYPVVIDGTGWVRVRAGDGLAGWTPAAGLSVVD